jgi:hypothetical protein
MKQIVRMVTVLLLALGTALPAQQGSADPAKPVAPPAAVGAPGGASAPAVVGGPAVTDTLPQSGLQTWQGFIDGLEAAGQRMTVKLPERLRNDPRALEESYRLLLAATARAAIDAIIGDRTHPVFVPEIGLALNIYQPNADTVYRSALIDAKGVYRLRGKRGSVLYFKLGQLGPDMMRTNTPSAARAYDDFNDLKLDRQGRFDVLLSAERPAGYGGDWWQLDPGTEKLMLRQVAYDWSREVDPTVSIERLDTPPNKPQLSAAEMSARLAELPTLIGNAATFFVDHVEKLRSDGYINKLHVFDLSNMSGLVGQFYYEGAYELAPDEALLVEAKVPDKCGYWSLILTDDVYETIDWYNNQSSLNGVQARVDRDGVFRAVIAAKDPGVPNWLDTAGNASGALQGRWLDCSTHPIPKARVVKLAQLRSLLPADTLEVTPEQRAATIRERRVQLQQRPLW